MQICRTLGTAQLRNLDPFLMLDEMRLPARAAFKGFPDHPHRCSAMRQSKARAEAAGSRVCVYVIPCLTRQAHCLVKATRHGGARVLTWPCHGCRGFETCSIMLEGQMEHRDSYGNQACHMGQTRGH